MIAVEVAPVVVVALVIVIVVAVDSTRDVVGGAVVPEVWCSGNWGHGIWGSPERERRRCDAILPSLLYREFSFAFLATRRALPPRGGCCCRRSCVLARAKTKTL